MFRKSCLVAIIAAVVALMASAVSAQMTAAHGTPFLDHVGVPQINGWYWLRAPGTSAKWVFGQIPGENDLPMGDRVCLYIEALVTQAVDGGCGYEATIPVKLTIPSRQAYGAWATEFTVMVELKNPFLMKDGANSYGVGYRTFGWLELDPEIVDAIHTFGSVDVELLWDGMLPENSQGPIRHVAVNADSVMIVY